MLGIGNLLGTEKRYGPVTVHGEMLRCVVCRHEEFWEHQVQLHTPTATFFNIEYLNRVANCAVCASCGYVHFFLPTNLAPEAMQEDGDVAAD